MFSQPDHIEFSIPRWVAEYAQSYASAKDLDERMRFVIEASLRNVDEQTGGPFAAAVFEVESGRLVSLGVNLVVSQGLSMLHAEMVAIALAQRKLGNYDLGAENIPALELLSSTEPCAMCLGSIPWSGVRHVAAAASDADARAIGFDEGAKPNDWVAALEQQHIRVSSGVLRVEACEVLRGYARRGGEIYNPHRD